MQGTEQSVNVADDAGAMQGTEQSVNTAADAGAIHASGMCLQNDIMC